MLNVFNFYDKPRELNHADLIDKMHLVESIVSISKQPNAKEILAPVINIIKKSPEYAYLYVITVLKKQRWGEVEPVIGSDAYYAFNYALNVLDGHRWIDAEPVIMKDPQWAYRYAETILSKDPEWTSKKGHENGRWPEAERYIIKNPEEAYRYAVNIIKGRWLEAEEYINKVAYWRNKYNSVFNIQ